MLAHKKTPYNPVLRIIRETLLRSQLIYCHPIPLTSNIMQHEEEEVEAEDEQYHHQQQQQQQQQKSSYGVNKIPSSKSIWC
jgi:hypothetical protein